jgi:RHS repeat-associated protein
VNVVDTLIYLHTDHLGSVSVATGASGQVVSQQEYDPWGKVRSGGIAQTTLNYTGQRLDGTGLLYYHARYYDPNLARFISPDSIVPDTVSGIEKNSRLTVDFHERSLLGSINSENFLTLHKGFWFQLSNTERQKYKEPWGPQNPQALNRYSYVLNNPLRYNDPTGHEGGKVINNSSQPIIVVGTDPATGKGKIAVVWPGESSDKYMPDADFWQPMDGGSTWVKVGDATHVVNDSTSRPGRLRYTHIKRCWGIIGFLCGPEDHEWGDGHNEVKQKCYDTGPKKGTCEDGLPYYQVRGCTRINGVADPSTWCGFKESQEYKDARYFMYEYRRSQRGR